MTEANNQYGDNVSLFLADLSCYKDDEIESGEFEVIGEDEQGREGSCNVSIPQLAAEAKQIIDSQNKKLESIQAALSQYYEFLSEFSNERITCRGQSIAVGKIEAAMDMSWDKFKAQGSATNDDNTSPKQ